MAELFSIRLVPGVRPLIVEGAAGKDSAAEGPLGSHGCLRLVIHDRDVVERQGSLVENSAALGFVGSSAVVGFGLATGDFEILENHRGAARDLKDSVDGGLVDDRCADPVDPCPSIINVCAVLLISS